MFLIITTIIKFMFLLIYSHKKCLKKFENFGVFHLVSEPGLSELGLDHSTPRLKHMHDEIEYKIYMLM